MAKVTEADRTAVIQCREARPAQSSAAMQVQTCGWPGVATGHEGVAAHELAILPTSLPLCRAVLPAPRAQSGEKVMSQFLVDVVNRLSSHVCVEYHV